MAKNRIRFVETLKPGQVDVLAQLSRWSIDVTYDGVRQGIPFIPYNGMLAQPCDITPEESFDLIIGVA